MSNTVPAPVYFFHKVKIDEVVQTLLSLHLLFVMLTLLPEQLPATRPHMIGDNFFLTLSISWLQSASLQLAHHLQHGSVDIDYMRMRHVFVASLKISSVKYSLWNIRNNGN